MLTCSNVLLTGTGVPKISGFEMRALLDHEEAAGAKPHLFSLLMTWMAPEVHIQTDIHKWPCIYSLHNFFTVTYLYHVKSRSKAVMKDLSLRNEIFCIWFLFPRRSFLFIFPFCSFILKIVFFKSVRSCFKIINFEQNEQVKKVCESWWN